MAQNLLITIHFSLKVERDEFIILISMTPVHLLSSDITLILHNDWSPAHSCHMGVRPTLTVRLFIMDVSSTNATYSRYSFYTNNMPLKCMLYYLCYNMPLPEVYAILLMLLLYPNSPAWLV